MPQRTIFHEATKNYEVYFIAKKAYILGLFTAKIYA